MAKDITVFTRNTCAYCATVKKWMSSKGINYNEVNLDEHPELEQEVFTKSGARTVPVTIITKEDNMQEVVVGPNFARLSSAAA